MNTQTDKNKKPERPKAWDSKENLMDLPAMMEKALGQPVTTERAKP
jgi:hypothetical protein